MGNFAKFSVTKLTVMTPDDFDPDGDPDFDVDDLFEELDALGEKLQGAMTNEINQMIEAGRLPAGSFVEVE